MMPGLHSPIGQIINRDPRIHIRLKPLSMNPLFGQLNILGPSRGHQSQNGRPVDAPLLFLASRSLRRKQFQSFFPHFLYNRTIPGRGLAVGSHHAQLKRNIRHHPVNRELVKRHFRDGSLLLFFALPFINLIIGCSGFFEELIHVDTKDIFRRSAFHPVPVTPEIERENALAGLLLSLDDGIAGYNVDIAPDHKPLAGNTQKHIARENFALGGRARINRDDLHLVACIPAVLDADDSCGSHIP